MIHFCIGTDYTRAPGLRFRTQGDFSGEAFREDVLYELYEKALQDNEKIEINLNGVYGYPPSFLEESFGGMVRKYGYTPIRDIFSFVCTERPAWIKKVNDYIEQAK